MVEKEVAESVDALDGVCIGTIGGEEGGVVNRYEAMSIFIGPELLLVSHSLLYIYCFLEISECRVYLVFPTGMELFDCLLSRPPVLGNVIRSLVCLVYDFWYHCCLIPFPLTSWAQQFAGKDRITSAILQKQAKQEPRPMHEQ
jgi:hypothetical protein